MFLLPFLMAWASAKKYSAKKGYKTYHKPKAVSWSRPGAALSRARITPGVPNQKMLVQKSIRTTTFKTVRTMVHSQFISLIGSESNVGLSWRLVDLPGSTEFTLLFDTYRITKIELTFRPCTNYGINNQYSTPSWYIVSVDFDNNTPQTTAQLREVDNAEICSAYKEKTIAFEPRASSIIAQGSAATGFAEAPALSWIDCVSTTVNHYGVKFSSPAANSNGIYVMDVTSRVFLEFKKTL